MPGTSTRATTRPTACSRRNVTSDSTSGSSGILQRYGHCVPSGENERDFLRAYDPRAFPPFAVTVDVVLLTVREGVLSVLLVERDTHPFRGRLALPGGFVEVDEDLDAAAVRRLEQETGVRRERAHVEQLGAFGDPRRDPRMRVISVPYLVFAPDLPA